MIWVAIAYRMMDLMITEIYYFSGTGNSYHVASILAQKLDARMKPIIPLLKNENIVTDADVIGLIFPIYDFNAPEILYKFIEKLHAPSYTYYFAICTYGVMPLGTMMKLDKVLLSNHKKLSAGFTIQMPHNGLGYTSIAIEKQKKMFTDFEKRSDSIVQYITSKKQGHIEKSNLLDRIVLIAVFLRLMPKIMPMLKQALLKGWNSLGFYSDESCNGCGICSKVCPVDNIQMNGEKPSWDDTCLSCFACFHWCPQHSIQIAKLTKKMQRYHHPNVQLSDILKQKEK
jgi:ferredoxin